MADNSITRLSEFLRVVRIKNGKKQKELANMLNISRQTYSHYETGRLVPSISSLKRIAEFYSMAVLPFIVMAVEAQENKVQDSSEIIYNDNDPKQIMNGLEDIVKRDHYVAVARKDMKNNDSYSEYDDLAYKDFIDYAASNRNMMNDLDSSEVLFYYQNLSASEKKAVKVIIKKMYSGQRDKAER